MPTPLGHALGGIAAGWLTVASVSRRGHRLVPGCVLAAAGAAPDLDLILGIHRGPAHSVGAAVIAGAIAWGVARAKGVPSPARWALAIALAWSSHVLLDWLGSDTTPPIGIMALWPFSHGWYESHFHIFLAVSRRYWLPEFWTDNLREIWRELIVVGPIAALAIAISTAPLFRNTLATSAAPPTAP
jgi:LexA-binding, inner membrane-associated putative hydrolase